MPGPFTDAGWDGWFVWGFFGYTIENLTTVGVALSSREQTVDSKAMRKITDDETIILVAESQVGAFEISMPLRVLLKLS